MADFPDNPNCEATHATFRFAADDLDPDAITAALGLTPDSANRKGDIRTAKNGRQYPYPRGGWKLTTRGLASKNLEAHIVHLLDRIEPVRERAQAFVRSHPGTRFEIMCYWMSATGNGGPSLSSATLGRLAALGVMLDFDLYSAV